VNGRVLVTGASGFIGARLVENLLVDGRDVVGISRNLSDYSAVPMTKLNLGYDPMPAELLSNVQCIFHLANVAHTELDSDQVQTYYQVNVEGTRSLLEAAVSAGVASFVYVSSVKAGEEHQPDHYGRSKRAAEDLVLEYGRQHRMHVCVIRPALVYGPEVKGNLQAMIQGIATRRFPWRWVRLQDCGNVRSMVSVEDVVRALLLVAELPAANGRIYVLEDGVPYTPATLQQQISAALDQPLPRLVIPQVVFRIMAQLGEGMQTLLHRRMPWNRAVYSKLFTAARYDSTAIRQELGWHPVDSFYSILPLMIHE